MMFGHTDMICPPQEIARLQFLVDSLIELQHGRSTTGLVPELKANRKRASISMERGRQRLHGRRVKKHEP